ncbi:DIP1984 family protein [Acidithiobacillus sp. CV18-2]|uniref:DIP1984 family protein n=1 Tax=Igneacidithiobacillus copahuensis TaxID=2724909 RepID=A0AAE3CKV4_9PROT|nr:DIP1984 family protein [Igneacidithiobacillus copahuensis]MBU2753351.1 DIP1984 family protein [Acidithiobacillus sp. CV18-3]MBU2756381.1 DIP1984 family protein [Acidithiobacillus sp. BN09-2]MBU2776168.1 DIP1984 family protein [Acidithiobacillus sp. CV18-2]MBU2795781.1 DIP1984 family protein [Acidithiobacillus sp. VAN18-2]MBU2798296.1 DIP1984 family protein [Acidithiobacillus sp. VAN18-4]UTV81674.1 DIP1984 family protein [Acidithiobacillus sp. YTS05]
MKLAEALVIRADTQKQLEQLKYRMLRNVKVQDGEKPAENPIKLIAEYEAAAAELGRLIRQINITNSRATVLGRTMTQALAERDVLKQRQAMYRDLAEAATVTQSVSFRSEIRFRSFVSVPEIQKKADMAAKELRELDARIQEANWRIDLLDY